MSSLSTPTFFTRWDDECSACGGPMPAGTEAYYENDEIRHAVDCDAAADPVLEEAVPPCPSCFTVPAINGACSCQ